eukprot:gene2836-5577_t
MSEVEIEYHVGGNISAEASGSEGIERGLQKRKSGSEEDVDSKLQRCRERNRFHARNTRERKKNQVEMMMARINRLNQERAVLSAQVVDTTVADILMTLSSRDDKTNENSLSDGNTDTNTESVVDGSDEFQKNNELKSLDQICQHVMNELVDDEKDDIKADLELLNKDKSACTSQELDAVRRERNRLHAKKTRLRKKIMLAEMETNLRKLEDEVNNLRKKKDQRERSDSINDITSKTHDTNVMNHYYDDKMFGGVASNMGAIPQYLTIAVPYGMVYNCGGYDATTNSMNHMNGHAHSHGSPHMQVPAHMLGNGIAFLAPGSGSGSGQSQGSGSGVSLSFSTENGCNSKLTHPHPHPMLQMDGRSMMQASPQGSQQAFIWPPYPSSVHVKGGGGGGGNHSHNHSHSHNNIGMSGAATSNFVSSADGSTMQQQQLQQPMDWSYGSCSPYIFPMMTTITTKTTPTPPVLEDKACANTSNTSNITSISRGVAVGVGVGVGGGEVTMGRERRIYAHHTESVPEDFFPEHTHTK